MGQDPLVLGMWHDEELVLVRESRLRWYASMRTARNTSRTWGEFLSAVAAVDDATATELRDVVEPDLDDAFDPDTLVDFEGNSWPGTPETAVTAEVVDALGPVLESAGGPGGVSYSFIHESDDDAALARLQDAGVPAYRDDELVGAAFGDDEW